VRRSLIPSIRPGTGWFELVAVVPVTAWWSKTNKRGTK
jgi:hypothetical protein